MYFHVKLLVLCSLSIIVSSYVNLPQFNKKEVDKLLRTPFILSSGEFYRDMLTIEAARSVADFAQNQEPENILQPQHFDGLAGLKIPPRFIPSKMLAPVCFKVKMISLISLQADFSTHLKRTSRITQL